MSVRLRNAPPLLAIALAFAAVGCDAQPSDDLPRLAVDGTVTWRGQPLDRGTIQFEPAAPGTKAVLEVAEIKAGAYALERARGLVPGDYRVVVSSVPPTQGPPPGEAPGEMPKRPKETIPAKYNQKSGLTAKVTSGGPTKFDFALTD